MVGLYARSESFSTRRLLPGTGQYSPVPARLAHEMAPKPPNLKPAPGWTKPGYGSWERYHQRGHFMRAAANASPDLVVDYKQLATVSSRAKALLGAEYLSWSALDSHVQVIEAVGEDWTDLSPQAQAAALEYRDALLRWQARYHLRAASERHHSGAPASDWILEGACSNLGLPGSPLPPGVVIYTPPVPYADSQLTLSVRGWDGTESAAEWHVRATAELDTQLRAHIERLEASLSARGFEPLPVRKTRALGYLELAARWQVLGQSWSDFLQAEKLPDGRERDARNLRSKINTALKRVGIQPRDPGGMKSNPGTTE